MATLVRFHFYILLARFETVLEFAGVFEFKGLRQIEGVGEQNADDIWT
jgi:hypothetical protein